MYDARQIGYVASVLYSLTEIEIETEMDIFSSSETDRET